MANNLDVSSRVLRRGYADAFTIQPTLSGIETWDESLSASGISVLVVGGPIMQSGSSRRFETSERSRTGLHAKYPDSLAWLAVVAALLLGAGTVGLAVAALSQAPFLGWASAACGTIGALGISRTLSQADELHASA